MLPGVATHPAAPPSGPGPFDDDFGFRSRLEALGPVVRQEWSRISPSALRMWPVPAAFSGAWAVLGLVIAGHRVDGNCRLAPRTAAFLDSVPGLYAAGFSVLGPRSSVPPHRGPEAGILRCSLGVLIPSDCGLRIGEAVHHWETDRTLVFDHTHLHDAWNANASPKVVLLVDFTRPDLLDGLGSAVTAQRDDDLALSHRYFPEWV